MAQFVLEILDGDRAGDVVSLGDRAIRIGRKPTNDLVIADEKASGVHAELLPEGDRFVLRDLGSTNGTLLEGRRITEVVLGSGDTFQIGRVRLRVRAEGEAPPAAEDGPAMGRLDTTRLRGARASRSVVLLGALLVVAALAGGYVWWRGRDGGPATTGPTAGPRPALQIQGNRLADAGGCESEEGWRLRTVGAGLQPGGSAHTGVGGFETVAAEGAAGFAVATSETVLTVLPGKGLEVAAHVRTAGGARGGVRLLFFGAGDGNPFQFRAGTPVQQGDGWTRVAAAVTVPPLADRCQVELVAVWPAGGSVAFDDVAVIDGAGGDQVEHKVEQAAAIVVGNSAAVAIRSMEQPTLLAVLPGAAPPELALLHDQGLLCLSDLGARATVAADARSCAIGVEGCDRMQLVFPADSAGGLLAVGEDGAFGGVAAASEFTTARILLGGERATRCLVELPAAGAVQGQLGGGRYRLTLPAARCTLVLGFDAERQAAGELLRAAQQAGSPGEALDKLRELMRTVPHDLDVLVQASTLRTDLLGKQAEQLGAIARDLEDAAFFDTRGGFERAGAHLQQLRQTYGDHNLADAAAVIGMQQDAERRLQAIEQRRAADVRQRLQAMAGAFEAADQRDLAELVREYLRRHVGGGGEDEPRETPGREPQEMANKE